MDQTTTLPSPEPIRAPSFRNAFIGFTLSTTLTTTLMVLISSL